LAEEQLTPGNYILQKQRLRYLIVLSLDRVYILMKALHRQDIREISKILKMHGKAYRVAHVA